MTTGPTTASVMLRRRPPGSSPTCRAVSKPAGLRMPGQYQGEQVAPGHENRPERPKPIDRVGVVRPGAADGEGDGGYEGADQQTREGVDHERQRGGSSRRDGGEVGDEATGHGR